VRANVRIPAKTAAKRDRAASSSTVLLSPRDAGFTDRLKDGEGLPLPGPPSWQAMPK
jgi:hypothetical protein